MQSDTPQHAHIAPSGRWSKIWFVPIVALLVGLWLLYQEINKMGPSISISFNSAQGLEVGKTRVKTRDVDIGIVRDIKLSTSSDKVIVTADMTKESAELLTEDASFWVVSPKASLSGVSGLSTIFSGAYIQLEPGTSDAKSTQFEGLEEPPLTPVGAPGLHITLSSGEEFAYSEGDPIVYKGLTVGKVDYVYFNLAERTVYYNAFIEAPYHKLVTNNTRFWNTSGIKVGLSSNGLTVQTGNLQTLLTNGVTFGVPPGLPIGETITKRTYFKIYPNDELATAPEYAVSSEFMLLLQDSVKGLQVNAPVEYRGIEVGRVLAINQEKTNGVAFLDNSYRIPVKIALYPGQLGLSDDEAGKTQLELHMIDWVSMGLRATLSTGSLLTGQQLVELNYTNDEPVTQLQTFKQLAVIPTTSGGLAVLANKLDNILDKINDLPVEQLSANLNDSLASADVMLQQMTSTLQNVESVLDDVKHKGLFNQLNATLASIEQLSKDFQQGSANQQQIENSLAQFERTLRQLEPVIQQINQTPNGLIFSNGQNEPEPKASQ